MTFKSITLKKEKSMKGIGGHGVKVIKFDASQKPEKVNKGVFKEIDVNKSEVPLKVS